MGQTVQNRAIDKANALGSRVLCALFAIMALCATPLGTGELLAAESYVYERQSGELRDGDLPLRFAVPAGVAQTFESAERFEDAALSSVVLDDVPGTLADPAALGGGEMGRVAAGPPSLGIRPGLRTSFEARAPPRA